MYIDKTGRKNIFTWIPRQILSTKSTLAKQKSENITVIAPCIGDLDLEREQQRGDAGFVCRSIHCGRNHYTNTKYCRLFWFFLFFFFLVCCIFRIDILGGKQRIVYWQFWQVLARDNAIKQTTSEKIILLFEILGLIDGFYMPQWHGRFVWQSPEQMIQWMVTRGL